MTKTTILASPRTLGAVVLLMSALTLAACGGGSGRLERSATRATSRTGSTTSTGRGGKPKPKPKPARPSLVELIKVNGKVSENNTAHAGDVVQLLTKLSPKLTQGPTLIHLDIAQAGPKWTVTADGGGHLAAATLTSATGKPFPLVKVHFSCKLPPTPSFCPAESVAGSPNHMTIAFRTTAQAPVALAATVGPLPGKSATPSSVGTTPEPPYIPLALVQAKTPGTNPKSAPTVTTVVSPGQEVVLRALLQGSGKGSRQHVTVGFGRGPGALLKLTVSVAGGQTSTATIKSSSGKAFQLVAATFSCGLPATASFCPASNVVTQPHHYSLTFSASPHTPIAIAAFVQAV